MEEARQHTSLTGSQWAFAAVFFGGHTAFVAGIVCFFAGYPKGILLGVAGLALSKTILALWAVARPDVQAAPRPKPYRIVVAVVWGALALFFFSTGVKP